MDMSCQERLPLGDDLGGKNKGNQEIRGRKATQPERAGSTKTQRPERWQYLKSHIKNFQREGMDGWVGGWMERDQRTCCIYA